MRPLLALLVLVAVALPTAARAIDVQLEYAPLSDRDAVSRSSVLKLSTTPPAGYKLPDATGKLPLYGTIRLGDSEHLLMLDRNGRYERFYTRLRVDANGNRDLTDDPPVQAGSSVPGAPMLTAKSFELKTKHGAAERLCQVSFDLYCADWDGFRAADFAGDPNKALTATIRALCCYKGEFELDGAHYEISLVDSGINGRLDHSATQSTTSGDTADTLFIKSGGEFGRDDGQPLGKYLVLGDKLFEVKVDSAAETLSLEPARGDAVAKLPRSVCRAAFDRPGGDLSVAMFRPAAQVSLPAGEWKMISYQLERADDRGVRWVLTAREGEKPVSFRLDATSATTCVFGEPFSSEPTVQTNTVSTWLTEHLVAVMRIKVKDCAGANMVGLDQIDDRAAGMPASLQNVRKLKNPTWQAFTADGKKVAAGSYEYG
ncbi:MAG: hypothetical protein ABFD69_02415 [Candidatus Sumerlaeia bacterium]